MAKKKLGWSEVGEVVAEIKRQGLTLKEGAKRFGISVWKLYEYNRRQKLGGRRRGGKDLSSPEEGAAPEAEASAPPVVEGSPGEAEARGSEEASDPAAGRGRNKTKLPGDVVDLIVAYRKENPLHGFRRIEQWLRNRYLIVVPRKRIREVLKEAGLLEPGDTSFDRTPEDGKGSRRFEALYPRQLWQMDHTHVYIEGLSVVYLVMVEDDYSRFCVGASLERSCDGETMIGVLHNAQARYGKPEKVLTDEGSCFYCWSMAQTRFQKYLDDMGIEHIVADPHCPETLGKVERLHQTLKGELLRKVRFVSFEDAREHIARYIAAYNYERPHQGLGGARPADRFFGLVGEKERVERELGRQGIDLSRGYMILTTGGHTVSVVSGTETLEVYLDGKPLEGRNRHGHENR